MFRPVPGVLEKINWEKQDGKFKVLASLGVMLPICHL